MIVALEGVAVTYGRRRRRSRALSDVDLVLRSGELVLVHGPPRAGKTTLLRALAGTVHPYRGRRRVTSPVARPGFFLLGEGSAPPEVGSVARLLRYGAFLAGLVGQAAEAGVRAMAREWDLLGHLHRPLGTLDECRARRASIAAALLQDPAALLLDEGFGADPDVDSLLRREARRGRLVVRVRRLDATRVEDGDRLVGLDDGRVVTDRRALRRAS